MAGKLYIVGVGPGHHDHMTFRAKQVIEESNTIVGYETYVNLVENLIAGKEVHRYAMTQEVERAHQCIDLAKSGKIVSLVSSGDPGIYGMAAITGLAPVDPFIMGLTQTAGKLTPLGLAAGGVVAAAASNNFAKAIIAEVLAGSKTGRETLLLMLSLTALGLLPLLCVVR